MEDLFPLTVLTAVFVLFILTVVFSDDEDESKGKDTEVTSADEWWEELRQSAHSRLVLPPDAFFRKIHPPNSKFSAKNIKNKGQMIYNKAKRMINIDNGWSNGYNGVIISEKVPAEHMPILCFVNTKSGGKHGIFAMKELKSLLNPVQVIDLQKCDPMGPLLAFSVIPSFRVLVCGGDGSVRWILNCIERLSAEQRPPVAILPLGTGNDLARYD